MLIMLNPICIKSITTIFFGEYPDLPFSSNNVLDGYDLSHYILYGDESNYPRTQAPLNIGTTDANGIALVFQSSYDHYTYKYMQLHETGSTPYCYYVTDSETGVTYRRSHEVAYNDTTFLFDLTHDRNESVNLLTSSTEFIEQIKAEALTYVSNYLDTSINAFFNDYLDCENAEFSEGDPSNFGGIWYPFYTLEEYVQAFNDLCADDMSDVQKFLHENRFQTLYENTVSNKIPIIKPISPDKKNEDGSSPITNEKTTTPENNENNENKNNDESPPNFLDHFRNFRNFFSCVL